MMNFVNRHLIGVSAFVVGLWVVFRLLGWPFSFVGGCLLLGWFGYLTWASRAVWWGWIKRLWVKRRPDTPGRQMLAQETATMLGVMGEAAQAGPEMTDEQRLLLQRSLPGMRARASVLLAIPNRSSSEEAELMMITRDMRKIEVNLGYRVAPQDRAARLWGGVTGTNGASVPGVPGTNTASVPPIRPVAGLGSLVGAAAGGWQLWAVGGVAAVSVLGYAGWEHNRAERFQAERNEAQAEARSLAQHLAESRELNAELANMASAADAQTQQTAHNIERERARRVAAERRERERQRELASVLSDTGEPPAWRLRDDGGDSGQPAPGPGDSSPGGASGL